MNTKKFGGAIFSFDGGEAGLYFGVIFEENLAEQVRL